MKHAAQRKERTCASAKAGVFVFAICLAMCIALSTAEASNGKGALTVAKDAVEYKAAKTTSNESDAENKSGESIQNVEASRYSNETHDDGSSIESTETQTSDGESDATATENSAAAQAGAQSEIRLDVPAYDQYAEGLPTGCESAALASVLGYYGLSATPGEVADIWLERSEWDFVNAFMGNPHTEEGGMVSAPGLQAAANKYLAARNSALRASDLSGASFDEVVGALDSGTPVIVWLTIGYEQPYGAYAWQGDYAAVANSHTVVLVGRNSDSSMLYFVDSIDGSVEMPAAEVARIYEDCGSQAMVVS